MVAFKWDGLGWRLGSGNNEKVRVRVSKKGIDGAAGSNVL